MPQRELVYSTFGCFGARYWNRGASPKLDRKGAFSRWLHNGLADSRNLFKSW